MRQSYLKNAALMTGADVLLRLAGMGLRIWLANALGGEGMGLYQLVLAVYSLFVTLATAGVSVAATRLLTEELSRDAASARGMLRRLLALGAGLGVLAMAAQAGLAGLAAKWWLGDVRAAGALRLNRIRAQSAPRHRAGPCGGRARFSSGNGQQKRTGPACGPVLAKCGESVPSAGRTRCPRPKARPAPCRRR